MFVTGSLDLVLKMAADEFQSMELNVPKLWRKLVLPGAGHWVQQERPEEVNKTLAEFLAAHFPA